MEDGRKRKGARRLKRNGPQNQKKKETMKTIKKQAKFGFGFVYFSMLVLFLVYLWCAPAWAMQEALLISQRLYEEHINQSITGPRVQASPMKPEHHTVRMHAFREPQPTDHQPP